MRCFVINFEGIDRSGKGTHTARLAKNLAGRGLKVATRHFPVLETPVGRLIGDFLAGRVPLAPACVQMLYAANRWEEREHLLAILREVDVLILDRWCPSGWAYGMAVGLPRPWLQNLDAGLPVPDLTILMEVPPEVAAGRRRTTGKDVLESDLAFQGRVAAAYRELAAAGGWAVVRVEEEKDAVEAKVLAVAERAMREAGALPPSWPRGARGPEGSG